MGKQWVYTDSLDGKPYEEGELKRVVVSVEVDGETTRWALYVTQATEPKLMSKLHEITKNEIANDPDEFPQDQPVKESRPKGPTGGDGLTPEQRLSVRYWEVMNGHQTKLVTRGRVSAARVEEWKTAGSPMITQDEYLEFTQEEA